MSKRIMNWTLALLVVLTTPVAMAQQAATSDAKAPRLTVLEPVKDFGTVAKGDKLDWTFEIKNTGNADLEIISARPACGCTVANFDKVIKPGQTGKVAANVDTTAFTGPIAKAVTLETNDPAAPAAQVTITAIVKPYVEAHPAGYVRFNMLQGDVDSQSVLLYSEETEPFEILRIETPNPWIQAEYEKVEGAQRIANVGREGQAQYRVNVSIGGPNAKVGALAEKVKIVTNSKHQPEYMLSVSGVVRPPFRVEPTGVNFGEVAPSDSAATRSVVLRSNNLRAPETFVVNKAESNVPGLTVGVKPTANKGEYEVTLQVAKDAKIGDIDGSVRIFTNNQVTPVVTVPVKGTIKKAVTATSASK